MLIIAAITFIGVVGLITNTIISDDVKTTNTTNNTNTTNETESQITQTLETRFSKHQTDYIQTVTLYPDETFTLHQSALEYGNYHNLTINGNYSYKFEKLFLNYNFIGDCSIILTSRGDNYVDQDGGIWVVK